MAHGIIVFGASGSGTTTLGYKLAKCLDFAHLDADDFFWEDAAIPFSVKRPQENRIEKLLVAISKCRAFVLSGSICGWDKPILPLLDLAVYVSTPSDIRLKRLEVREFERFGKRINEGGDMYKSHHEFIEWAKKYDTSGTKQRSHALHTEWAKTLGCPVITVDGTSVFAETTANIASRYYIKSGEPWKVTTAPLGKLSPLRFVVIFARYNGMWIYARHKQRTTWETPGGHIELDESPHKAAKRELYEETGVTDCSLTAVFEYAVHTDTEFSYGRVFIAEVNALGNLPESEMAEITLFSSIPNTMTYPQILPTLYKQMQVHLSI